jgi:hypothetical protein
VFSHLPLRRNKSSRTALNFAPFGASPGTDTDTSLIGFDTKRKPRSAGVEDDQFGWLICGIAPVNLIDAFRQGLARAEDHTLPSLFLFQGNLPGQNIPRVDHRVLMPIQSGIGRDCNFENRYFRLSTSITSIGGPVPGMGCLEQLFDFDAGVVSIGNTRKRQKPG